MKLLGKAAATATAAAAKDEKLIPIIAIAIAALLVGVFILLWFFGSAKGKANVISGCVVNAEGLDRKKKVYVQISCMAEKVSTTSIAKSDNPNWNHHFTWSFRGRKEDVVLKDHLTFDVFEANGSKPAVGDKKVTSVDLSVKALIDAGIGYQTTRTLSGSAGQTLTVSAGLYSNNIYLKFLDRLNISWQQERRKVSFWTRIITLPIAIYIFYSGLKDTVHAEKFWPRMLAIADCATGVYFLWQCSHFYLAALGIQLSDAMQPKSLSFAWSLCLAVMGYMITAGKWLSSKTDGSHGIRIYAVGLLFVGYLVSDLRGEPGAGWLSVPGRLVFTQYSA